MSIRDEITRLAQRIDGLFRGRQVPFAFMGGVAVNVWAIPAATYDLGLCADLDLEHVRDVVGKLDALGFVPPPSTWLDAVGRQEFRKFTV